MPGSDFTTLNQAVTDLTAQVSATVGTENSAIALINGFSTQIQAAVADALTADDAADQGSITAAQSAIAAVTTQFNASAGLLGAAVAANPGPATGASTAPSAAALKR